MRIDPLPIARPSGDIVERHRSCERRTFQTLRIALIELADTPLRDEIGVARARVRYRDAKANWASALRVMDRYEFAGFVALGANQ